MVPGSDSVQANLFPNPKSVHDVFVMIILFTVFAREEKRPSVFEENLPGPLLFIVN